MADYDYSNPFAGVLTPDALFGQREADIQRRYDPAGFWVGEAARAGSRLRKQLNERGIAMGAEDEKALNNQSMMEGIQRNLAEQVEAGTLSEEEAQTEAIKMAMKGFMSSGDYQSAASLKPALDAIQRQELEREKLRAEAFSSSATGTRQLTDAARLASRTPYEVDLLKAQADKNRGAGKAESASIAAWEKGTGPEPDWRKLYNKSDLGKQAGQVDSAGRVFQRLGNIAQLVHDNPGLGSNTAGTLAAIQDEVIGFGNTAATMLGLMDKEDKDESLSVAARRKAEVREAATIAAKRVGATGDSLNVARGKYESMIMDLAYALAKARDPGGRLSDADVNNAMQIIGSAGDPERMIETMRQLAKETHDDVAYRIKTVPYLRSASELEEARSMFFQSYKDYNDLLDSWKNPKPASPAKPPPSAAAAPPAGVDYTFQKADGSGMGQIIVATRPKAK